MTKEHGQKDYTRLLIEDRSDMSLEEEIEFSRRLLQKVAREQDLLDGGIGQDMYQFTRDDVLEAQAKDWLDHDTPDNNIAHMPKKHTP